MKIFSHRLVGILRHDITHLDLSVNKIRNFEFLRGFKSLKSLVVDKNNHIDLDSIPPMNSLELFYANNCSIEYPSTFIFRVSVVFQSLKYLSMMTNPLANLSSLNKCRDARAHSIRMFAIFMNSKLIHFNDKKITENEKEHSNVYHKCLGPTDCHISEFKKLPATEEMKELLPVFISDKPRFVLALEDQDVSDKMSQGLTSVSISDYFKLDNNLTKSVWT